jgi:hypothetical protein
MKVPAITLSSMLLACAQTTWKPQQIPPVSHAAPAPLMPVAQTAHASCSWPAPETKLALVPTSKEAFILFATSDDDVLRTLHARAYSLHADHYRLAMIDSGDGSALIPVPSRTRLDLTGGGSNMLALQRSIGADYNALADGTCTGEH